MSDMSTYFYSLYLIVAVLKLDNILSSYKHPSYEIDVLLPVCIIDPAGTSLKIPTIGGQLVDY